MGIRATLLSSVLLLGVPGIANAIPNQHLNPHSDDPADISWQQDPLAVPDTTNHLHIEDVNITFVEGLSVIRTGITHNNGAGPRDPGGKAAESWDWQSGFVWDNRDIRYVKDLTPPPDRNSNALRDNFGHGYIDPAFRPRYAFADDVPADAKLLVDQAMSMWDARAKDEGEESRTTPVGTPLKTSAIFEKVVSGAHEVFVDFVIGLDHVLGGDVVAAVVFDETPVKLYFEASPLSQFFVPRRDENGDGVIDANDGVWKISTDGLPLGDISKVFADVTGLFGTGWSFDMNPDVLFNNFDFDYMAPTGTKYEGDEAFFAGLGITLKDSWGGFTPFAATSTIDIYETDFFSVALHEWGHVLGFNHSNGGVMGALAPFSMNYLTQTIDDENAFGAAAMYSIPAVPEPDGLILFAAGLIGLLLLNSTPEFARLSRQ